MTISSEVSRVSYSGNDAATSFTIPFKIFSDEHVEVIVANVAGSESVKTLGVDYSVAGVGEDNSTLTYPLSGSPLATGETLAIRRKLPILQSTDLLNQGAFFAEVHEETFDTLTMVLQQHQEELDRCPKVTVTSGSSGAEYLTTIEGEVALATAARIAAQAAQAGAQTARTNAETAVTNAQAQVTLAQAEVANAQTARDAAIVAKNDAQTAAANASAAATAAVNPQKESITITATDVSNGYADMSVQAKSNSLNIVIPGVGSISEDVDYSVSVVNSKTRITFLNDISSTGIRPIATGDKLCVKFFL